MLVCNPYESCDPWYNQQKARFSDQATGRSACAVFCPPLLNDNRLSYSNWVRPILVDNVRCVAVDKKVGRSNPQMFRFLMDFAADNVCA